MTRRNFSAEFKQESANLVLSQGYTIQQACDAMGVGPTAMRRWVSQLKAEHQGITPIGSILSAIQEQAKPNSNIANLAKSGWSIANNYECLLGLAKEDALKEGKA